MLDCKVLTRGQTNGPVEQNRAQTQIHTFLEISFLTYLVIQLSERKAGFLKGWYWDTWLHKHKNKAGPLPHTTHNKPTPRD